MTIFRQSIGSISSLLARSSTPSTVPIRFISKSYTTMSSSPFAQAQLSESVSKLATTGEPKIHLYTVGTPNGHKASILLEELIAAYPNDKNAPLYDFIPISFAENTQKTPEFLKINPNGRIPALIDDNVQVEGGKGHNVFESVSIMLWLVEKYDKENKFWFGQEESVLRSKGFSWMVSVISSVSGDRKCRELV